ncbi:3-hydroxybutyryl-CoA dehydrogenase [Paenibacillus rhizosphaerae]|uniref:L-gulonate 3-dehydrogenase n=1 Tax=Paenibacillus rhizosphaerae TaxID=297318 RepID=A0A839TQ69_9BACL|nr:3-hydroxyacyl-CoA dehydrogenase NAD-binding domain-containing protein [Paenibacillus rhizosphaerae]MBB3129144.1 3-hydroxybutyryl-CoA dehydrogenase [Paenibacillus rhizosphaerae]
MRETLSVLGAGLMGHSIALTAAWAGFSVVLQGQSEAGLARADKGICDKLALIADNGLIKKEDIAAIRRRIRTTLSVPDAVANASFVIESIPEQLELKRQLYKELDALCNESVVLASNTSGLSPTAIAERMKRPERMVVTHFWNPAHLLPLVEVVRGVKTDDKTTDRTMQLMRAMDKKPILLKKDALGSVGNRLQYALFREAQYILEQGIASMEDIDAAMTYSLGRRLPITGPFMTADMGGLEVFDAISNYLFADLSKADQSLGTMRELVDSSKYGLKTGAGFYEWDEESSAQMNKARELELIRFLKRDMGLE